MIKKVLSGKVYLCPFGMRPNFKTYYFTAIGIGLAVGIYTEDKYIGILLAVALVLAVAGMKQRYDQGRSQ